MQLFSTNNLQIFSSLQLFSKTEKQQETGSRECRGAGSELFLAKDVGNYLSQSLSQFSSRSVL